MIAHRIACVAAILVALAFAHAARAHDFGSLKVEATFTETAYNIDITLFAEHFTAEKRPRFPLAAEYIERFVGAATVLFDDASARFEVVTLSIFISPDDQTIPMPTLRLTGEIPAGAKVFEWKHAWPADDYLFTARSEGDEESTPQWVRGTAAIKPFVLGEPAAPRTMMDTVVEYLKLGFEHIVPKGLDHILFVLGLFLLSLKPRAILLQVTAFTIAHSVTLALSIYGVVRLSPSIVEPLIALSIAFVAIENIMVREARPRRAVLVFAFGLLHGLGFAGVLTGLGLPRSQFVPALISFNVGVELGQLAVIAAAYLAVGLWFGKKPWYRSRITIPASVVIACVGVYWTVERVIG